MQACSRFPAVRKLPLSRLDVGQDMDLTLPSVVVRTEGSEHHNKDQTINSDSSVGTTLQTLLDKESKRVPDHQNLWPVYNDELLVPKS
jgi:hypothetical protein